MDDAEAPVWEGDRFVTFPLMTLLELVRITNATLAESAPGEIEISGVASLEDAGSTDITFFANNRYAAALRETKAAAAFVPVDFQGEASTILLRVADPSAAFAKAVECLRTVEEAEAPGIHGTAVVAEGAQIDPTAHIGAYVVVEKGVTIGARAVIGAHAFIGRGSKIGESCQLHAGVTIRSGSVLGRRVVVNSGAVIGSEGFGYSQENGRHVKIPQLGFVQLDDDVEVGACTTIDRARFGRTWIQEGTKIDNLVQIAHNVVIGKHCLVIAQTGISGSARLGQYVTLAGQVGVVGHVTVGDFVTVAAKSGISKDTPARQTLLGMIGYPIAEERKLMAHYRRLPSTVARLKALEAEMAELKSELKAALGSSPNEN